MAEKRNTFLLRKDWVEVLETLTSEEAGLLFRSIFRFVNNEAVNTIPSPYLDAVYNAIIEQIVYEWGKFNPKTGKYHWNYQGGKTPQNKIIRNSIEMKYWREKVFKRDFYTCQHCMQTGGELNAHHIKPFSEYPELRTDVNNGITLCKECHINEHKKQRNGKK